MELPPDIALSPIDEERFGVRTARAAHVTPESLRSIFEFCQSGQVRLLIARCDATDLKAAQAMERAGFTLMDTLVYFARDLARSPIPPDTGLVPVRPIGPGEAEQVKAVAADAFKGYFGHYHADERLDRAACDEAYRSWAVRSCMAEGVADEVLVAEMDGSVAGFATMRLNSTVEGEGVLFGVSPAAQGRGIYRSFMIGGMNWCQSKGATRMVVSTQITNIAVQKVWARVGFEPSHSRYTFHRWFDA